jgi:hypothetical protein
MRNEPSGACPSEYYDKLNISSARVATLGLRSSLLAKRLPMVALQPTRAAAIWAALSPLFFNTVESKSSESPVAGKVEKGVSRFVGLGFGSPLDACAGKLPIFAECDHGGASPLKSSRH